LLTYSISTEGCKYNANLGLLAEGGTPELKTDANDAANSLLKVSSLLWVCMHIVGGMIRSMTHIEPYYEAPEDPDAPAWKVLMFQRCGP
jgi:hypothetical protein